jgi:hypothetical protein
MKKWAEDHNVLITYKTLSPVLTIPIIPETDVAPGLK